MKKIKIYNVVVCTVYNNGETTTWCEANLTRFDALKSIIRELQNDIERDHNYAASPQEIREGVRRAFDEGCEGETHNAILRGRDFVVNYDIFPDTIEK